MRTPWEDVVDKTRHPVYGCGDRIQTHLQSCTLDHCPFSSGSPQLCTAIIETHSRKTHATEWLLLSLGFKGWWNTQRKTLWSNLAKGGKAPTAWQGLMSESTDPTTCPSIAANPPAGLVAAALMGGSCVGLPLRFYFLSFTETAPQLKASSGSHGIS